MRKKKTTVIFLMEKEKRKKLLKKLNKKPEEIRRVKSKEDKVAKKQRIFEMITSVIGSKEQPQQVSEKDVIEISDEEVSEVKRKDIEKKQVKDYFDGPIWMSVRKEEESVEQGEKKEEKIEKEVCASFSISDRVIVSNVGKYLLLREEEVPFQN